MAAHAAAKGGPRLFVGFNHRFHPALWKAKAVCAGCPVRKDCLEFALDTSQEYGIWGGYDEDERRPLRRQWRRSRTARLS